MDLVKNLEEYYGKEYPEVTGVKVREFVERYQLDNDHTKALFWQIVKDNSFLPDVRKINDAFEETLRDGKIDLNNAGMGYHSQHADKGLAKGVNLTIEQIATQCGRISVTENPSTTDVDFLHAWDGLYYAYNHLKRVGWEPSRYIPYLEEVKKSVLEGKFAYTSLPEIPDRDPIVDVKQVLERRGKMVEFEQLKIFDSTAKNS